MATLVIMCSKCGKKKKIDSFYTNKMNKSQNGRDFWCKEDVHKFVKDKETLQVYCLDNQRVFSEELWSDCSIKTENKYSGNPEYNSLSEEKRLEFAIQKTLNGYYSRQNQQQYYTFIFKEGQFVEDDIENEDVEIEQEYDDSPDLNKKKYSVKWGGDFTIEDLEYLERQYKSAKDDYDLKTTNDSEYAQNVAVAGLIVRKARSAYLNGVTGADKRWKEAVSSYDSLCTSAKFNQKTRTENSNSGLGSFGETFKRLEEMGFEAKPVIFPKDSIDVILEEYAHSHVALRGALDDVK